MTATYQLEVRRPDKEPVTFDIDPGTYTVGSEDSCKIHLNHESISGRHAILSIHDNECWLEDLASTSGTTVDGISVDGRIPLKTNQLVTMGSFTLSLIKPGEVPAPPAPTPAPQTPAPEPEPVKTPEPAPVAEPTAPAAPDTTSAKKIDPEVQRRRSIKQQIHKELVERMDIRRLSSSKIDKDELRNKAMSTINAIVADVKGRLPDDIKPDDLAKEIYDEALRLGPLEEFLEDETISEIMVNGASQVFVEKNGKLVLTGKSFMDDTSVLAIIERIVSPIGRRIDESQPYVDARLHDGSRVNAIIHPLSLIGPCLTIRKFSKVPFTDKDLIGFGTMTDQMAEFIKVCVKLRKNIVVSGGTGSGKTSLLNVISSYLPETDRIVTIEDAAELRLNQTHVVRLEARPPNIEGKGAIPIRDLVKNSLRMRPDRVVVGECRGGEALDMLQAMNTGHDGSLTTVHANTPRDVISRLETMVLMSGMDLPVRAIREQVASAIDMVVHESRFADGSRKVVKITEVIGLEGDQITMQDIFEYVQTGVDEEGVTIGDFRPTGAVPTFMDEAAKRGISFDREIFNPTAFKE